MIGDRDEVGVTEFGVVSALHLMTTVFERGDDVSGHAVFHPHPAAMTGPPGVEAATVVCGRDAPPAATVGPPGIESVDKRKAETRGKSHTIAEAGVTLDSA